MNVNTLFFDIEQGNVEAVIETVQSLGVDVTDSFGRTPLINATFSGNTELVRWLIEHGAEIDAQDKNGWTALHFAIQECHTECVQILLAEGADPNTADKNGNTPAFGTILNWRGGENKPNLAALLGAGADLKLENHHGRKVFDMVPDPIKEELDIT